MNAKTLQTELEEALLRGANLALEEIRALGNAHPALDSEDLDRLMRERAANLAAGYASRMHADADTTEGLAVEALKHARDLMTEALAAMRRRADRFEPRHNNRLKFALSKLDATLALWGRK